MSNNGSIYYPVTTPVIASVTDPATAMAIAPGTILIDEAVTLQIGHS